MVVLPLPSSLNNFEGRINHTAIAGCSETLVFVSPIGSDHRKAEISARLKDIAENLIVVSTPSLPKQGEAYIAKVGALLERAHIIRRPKPTRFQIYLIDQGFQDEVEYTDLFEYPNELLDVGAFVCICPVLVPSDELPKLDDTLIDRKCLCNVEGVAKSVVVFGFVKGQLLMADLNGAVDLSHEPPGGKSGDSLDSSTFDGQTVSSASNSSSESELICSSNASEFDEGICRESDEVIRGQIGLGRFLNYNVFGAASRNKQLGAFFKQTAFNEFSPDDLPVIINVRFDKMDRLYSTFWVVNAKTFTAVEQVLRTSHSRLSCCPNLRITEDDILANNIPCVVRTRTDSPFKEFYRAVPIRFDRSSRRFSIFLVDFGWFKWVVANDVYNISTLDNMDPIRTLPVALIHCREEDGGSLHAKDLVKGRECKMMIRERGLRSVFAVSLYNSSEQPSLPSGNTFTAEEKVDKLPSPRSELNDFTSCRKLINDVCVQQLKVSLMMETLSTSPSVYQQSWMGPPGMYPNPSVVPFMPIVPMPFIMPFQNGNVASAKDVLPTSKNPTEHIGKSTVDKNATQLHDHCKEWGEDNLQNFSRLKRHEPGFSPSRKGSRRNMWEKENCLDEKNFNWDKATKGDHEQRHGNRKGWIGNVPRNASSSWELAANIDRIIRRKPDVTATNVGF